MDSLDSIDHQIWLGILVSGSLWTILEFNSFVSRPVYGILLNLQKIVWLGVT